MPFVVNGLRNAEGRHRSESHFIDNHNHVQEKREDQHNPRGDEVSLGDINEQDFEIKTVAQYNLTIVKKHHVVELRRPLQAS